MKLSGENLESEKFATWLRFNKYKFTHIANESGLPPRVAMLSSVRKKRMGLSPGFPDYLIKLKNKKALFFIELKKIRAKKKNGEYKALSSDGIEVSEEQKEWINTLNEVGQCEACVCFGSDEAIKKVQELEDK